MTAGIAFEALNHAGHLDDNVLSVDLEKKIILVDPIKGIIDND